jgi:polyvinyl alcohol dehydrogenase (cytochrome)
VWTPVEAIGPDFDFGAGPQLFEAEVDGEMRPLVGAGQKSGIYWGFDRATGEIVWQTFVGFGAVGGGIHAEASVGDGKVYVWSNNSYTYGEPPKKFPITIKALDAATGENLWFNDKAQPAAIPAAGMLANDVYFVGSLDGTLGAYSASDGKQLWSTQYGGAIATPLNVVGNTLFFGTGVPKMFGGQPGGNGMVAYSVGGQANLEQQNTSTGQ